MRGKLPFVPFDESPRSYYITITGPSPPKIKIKIPKLVAKTMQKRFHSYEKRSTIDRTGHHDHDDENSSDKSPKKVRLGKLLTLRTVRSVFTNAFGSHAHGNHENVVKSFEKSSGDRAAKRAVVVRKRESAGKLVNASKRVMLSQRTFGMVGSLRKMGSKRLDLKCLDLKHVNPAQEKNSLELCKKRILMGSKCKPLTVSGALHYDKNGVLVPEGIP